MKRRCISYDYYPALNVKKERHMSLIYELEQFRKEFLAKFPKEKADIMARADMELAAQHITKSALKTGDMAPEFMIPDAMGKIVSLKETLTHGAVIIVFYRGGWCPYCNLELRAYQRLLPKIRDMGAQLMAISLQSPDASLSTQEKNALAFPILSDLSGRVSKDFGLFFTLPDYLQELYTSLGHDLPRINAMGQWTLPIPATYVVAQDGHIIAHHVDIDYRTRMEPEEALDAIVKHQDHQNRNLRIFQ